MCPSYLWQCQNCEEIKRLQATMDDRNIPPSSKAECEHVWERILEMPRVLKESYPAGMRKERDQDYSNMMKASELGVEMLKHRPDSQERKDMSKEKHRLEGKETGIKTRKPTEEKS